MAGTAFQISHAGISEVWQRTRGAGVKVGVLDSGTWTSSALPESRVLVRSAGGGEPQPTGNGHGTFCASLIGSEQRGAEGAAPEAEILSIQVISSDDGVRPEDVVRGLRLALAGGCDVVSCSFILPDMGEQRRALQRLVRRAHLAGVPVIVAAGNSPGNLATFAEHIPHAIVVSAHDALDQPMAVHFNEQTDVLALGERLDVVGDRALATEWEGQTSGATALVSGVVALALSSVVRAERAALGRRMRRLLRSTGQPLARHGVPPRLDVPALFSSLPQT